MLGGVAVEHDDMADAARRAEQLDGSLVEGILEKGVRRVAVKGRVARAEVDD